MITKGDRIAFMLIGFLLIVTFVFWDDVERIVTHRPQPVQQKEMAKKDKKKNSKKEKENTEASAAVSILKKWDMPSQLLEISGIVYIDDQRIARVQDELGKIYIYNTEDEKVEKEISFGKPGDYEGIAVVGPTAYVLRADGTLFEVKDYKSNPSVVQHATHLTAKQDVEGLTYDQKNNRLLLAIKGKETNSTDYKGIYAFDLATKKTATEPVHKINLSHALFSEVKGKNKIEPSDIDIHPHTGDIYITDGADPKILVMNSDGTEKNIYQLSKSEFAQPEGITFSPAGDLFISNEGRKGTGNNLKVSITP